jgi:hypothetical protein
MKRRLPVTALLAALVILLSSAPAAGQGNPYPVPAAVSRYTSSGEAVVGMKPVLVDGVQYDLYYFIALPNPPEEFALGDFLYEETPASFQKKGLTGLLVMSAGKAVIDEAVLHRVLQAELSAYMLMKGKTQSFASVDEEYMSALKGHSG